MEETILKDIRRIEQTSTDYEASILQKELIAKYRGEIDHIEHDLDYGDYDMEYGGYDRSPYYTENIVHIKGKLEVLLAKIRDEKNKPQTQPYIVNTNTNTNSSDNYNNLSNTNNNTIDIKVLFEDARNKIEDDTSLSDAEVEEILDKINELEELHKSDERPRGKWAKSKEVMTWLYDKGAKVASTILPLIIKVIEGQ